MASNQETLEQREQQAVDYIRANADLEDLAVVDKIYRQLSRQGTFQTAVGLDFLRELEARMISEEKPKDNSASSAKANPAVKMYTKEEVIEQIKKAKAAQLKKVQILTVSTVILAVMVVIMLGISMTSKLPTILNYKNMVTDEYAGWETELRNREEEVRRREKELLEKESEYVESLNQEEEPITYYDTEDMDALSDVEEDETEVDMDFSDEDIEDMDDDEE